MLDLLDDTERGEVVSAATTLQLKTHDILAQQGAPAASFYVIEVGRVRVSQTSDSGQETSARTAGPGQTFGGTMLIGRPRYMQSARAMQPTRVLSWTRPLLMALIDKYPHIKTHILDAESRPDVVVRARFEDPGEGTVAGRVSYVITRLASNGSRIDGLAIDILHPLTGQDLADLTGSELVDVTALLKGWEEEGVVQRSWTHLRVLNPARIEALAEG